MKKRALTGVFAASVVMGTALAPVTMAATITPHKADPLGGSVSSVQQSAITVDGETISNPYELIVTDHGSATTYLPIWYLSQALKKAGFTTTWDGNSHTWELTTENNTLDFSSVDPGSGNTTVTVNGKVVTKFDSVVHLDPSSGKNPIFTTFAPVASLQAIFNAASVGGNWDAVKKTFGMTSGPVVVSAGNTYGPTQGTQTLNKNVVVTGTNSNLSNLVIHGTLYVNPGADGTSNINNVSVDGSIIVLSGADHSIHLKNVQAPNLIVNSTSAVHIVSEGSTAIANTQVSGTENQAVTLEQASGSLGNVQISSSAAVTLSGTKSFTNVNVASASPVTVTNGTMIQTLAVSASNAKVSLQSGSTVSDMSIANNVTGVSVQNDGQVKSFTNNSPSTSVYLTGSGSVLSTSGNQPSTGTTSTSGSSSSGSSSSSSTSGTNSSSGSTTGSSTSSTSTSGSTSSGGTSGSGSTGSSSSSSGSSSGGTSGSGTSVSGSSGSSSTSGSGNTTGSTTSTASAVTDIKSTQTYVTNVVNTPGSQSITIPYGLTVQELENGIGSADGSTQTYSVLDGSTGIALTSSNTVTTGSELRITAANGTNQITYQINILPSQNTEIKDGADSGTYIKNINNTPGTQSVTVAWKATAQELTSNLVATDGSSQTYTVADSTGAAVTGTTLLATGDVLTVKAADNSTSLAYQVNIAPSSNTQIQDSSSDNGTYVTSISNTSGSTSLNVATNTTVSQLTGALQSTDGTTQTYAVYSDAGLTNQLNSGTGLISGDYLKVTAADSTATATYAIAVGSSPTGTSSSPQSPIISNNTSSNYINSVNDTSYVVSGTGTAGDTISVMLTDSTNISTTPVSTIVNSSGNWSISTNASSLKDGLVTIKVSDTTNATSATSISLTKDTVAPQITQSSLNSDGTITLTFNKDLNQVSAQSIGNYSVTDGSSADSVSNVAYSNTGGVYTATLTMATAPKATDTLSVDVSSSVVDLAGNPISTSSNTADYSNSSWTITSASSGSSQQVVAPVISNTSSSYINSSNNSAYAITGTGKAGDTISLTMTDSASISTAPVTATVDSNGNWSATVNAHTLTDGQITINAIDTTTSSNSNPVTITKDTVGPQLTRSVLNSNGTITLTFNEDLGQSGAQNTSNYTVTDGSTADSVTSAAYYNALNSYTVTLTLATPPASTDAISVDLSPGVADLAGNAIDTNYNAANYNGSTWTITSSSGGSGSGSIQQQATPPLISNGSSSYISSSNANSFTVSGTGTVGDSVSVTLTDSTGAKTAVVSTSVYSTGSWSVWVNASSMKDGAVTIDATDTTTNSKAAPVTVTKDTVGPQLTNAVLNSDGTITLTYNEAMDPTTTQTTANYTVTDGTSSDSVTSATYSNNGGTYSVTLTMATTPKSTDTISVDVSTSITDLAGNQINSNEDTANYNGTSWTVGNIVSPVISNISSSYINSVNANAYVVTGTGAPGDTVSVTLTDSGNTSTTPVTATVNSSGNWSATIDAHTLMDGQVTIKASDTTNSTSAQTVSVTKDTAQPQLMQAALNSDGTITLTFNKALNNTCQNPANYTVTDQSNSDAVNSVTYSGSGSVYTVTLTLATAPQSTNTIDIAISSGLTDLTGNPISVSTDTADYNGTTWTIS